MMKKLHTIVLAACFVYFLGCLDADRTKIQLDIQPDLTGTMTIEFTGIQSREKKIEDQKKELAEFYNAGYVQQGNQIAQEWSLENAKSSLSNQGELKCDGKVTGEVTDLFRSLLPLLDERDAEYEVKRLSNTFAFTVRGIASEKNDITFALHYSGKILENNAHHYDEAKHLMEWNFQKLNDSGIHFVLETRS